VPEAGMAEENKDRTILTRTLVKYRVRLLDDQPLTHRIQDLEARLDNENGCAAKKLTSILRWIEEISYGLMESDICIAWNHKEVLLISIYERATFYYVVRERNIYPIGVVFESS
jgi:hypothetical protein